MALEPQRASHVRNPEAAVQAPPAIVPEPLSTWPDETSEVRGFLRRGVIFVLIGLVLYAGLYVVAENLVYRYTVRNRFYAVKTAPLAEYDHVILGASRAAVFDYQDMNAHLEEMTDARILNLSVEGGGVTINRLLLDYFLARHHTANVVYFLDSFAFYSQEWNEERIRDVRLYNRAPFDPVLARLLFQDPATRTVALDYLVGFSKINNPDRFKSDISEEEAVRFEKTYRPVAQIDRQRISYLYPEQVNQAVFERYLDEFEDLIRVLQEQGIGVIIVKPPIPERVYDMIPNEGQFDAAINEVLQRYNVEFYDFSAVGNAEEFFFNTDHLNRAGALNFCDNYLVQVLAD
jgi:hypothetical protein